MAEEPHEATFKFYVKAHLWLIWFAIWECTGMLTTTSGLKKWLPYTDLALLSCTMCRVHCTLIPWQNLSVGKRLWSGGLYLMSNSKMISSFSFRGMKRFMPVYLRGFHGLSAVWVVCGNFLFEAERISKLKYDKIVHQHLIWTQKNSLGYDLRPQSCSEGYREEKHILDLLGIKPWPNSL
jgi:hypothetical protein